MEYGKSIGRGNDGRRRTMRSRGRNPQWRYVGNNRKRFERISIIDAAIIVIVTVPCSVRVRCVGGGGGRRSEDHPKKFRVDVMSVWSKDEAFDDACIGQGRRSFHGGK